MSGSEVTSGVGGHQHPLSVDNFRKEFSVVLESILGAEELIEGGVFRVHVLCSNNSEWSGYWSTGSAVNHLQLETPGNIPKSRAV